MTRLQGTGLGRRQLFSRKNKKPQLAKESEMNAIIYMVGLVVIVLAIVQFVA